MENQNNWDVSVSHSDWLSPSLFLYFLRWVQNSTENTLSLNCSHPIEFFSALSLCKLVFHFYCFQNFHITHSLRLSFFQSEPHQCNFQCFLCFWVSYLQDFCKYWSSSSRQYPPDSCFRALMFQCFFYPVGSCSVIVLCSSKNPISRMIILVSISVDFFEILWK